jgi:hypothetical protein
MLSPAKVEEVRRLLARGNVSQRKIARLLDVSRGSVNAIASGKRPDYPVKEPDEDDLRCWLPPVRCSGCGGMVYAPCRLCRVRAGQPDIRLRLSKTSQVDEGGETIKPDRCSVPAVRAAVDFVAADLLAVDHPAAPRVGSPPENAAPPRVERFA